MSSFLFIDDSGSKQWDTPYSGDFVDHPPARTTQNRTFWQNNYFVLAGIHLDIALMRELNPKINAEKLRVFGTKHVEIRSVHLRNPEKRQKHYLDAFGITETTLKEFVEQFWYDIFETHTDQIQIQAVILDKRYYKNPRVENKPLELATQALFDRVELHPNRQCTIVFDQMDAQIKSKTRDQGQILKISDKTIDLDSFRDKYSHTSVSFEKSHHSNFLQLADTAAYNVLRQFIEFGDSWEGLEDSLKMYPYFDRISKNLYCHPTTQQVKGYGLIKLPDPKGKKWKKTN